MQYVMIKFTEDDVVSSLLISLCIRYFMIVLRLNKSITFINDH